MFHIFKQRKTITMPVLLQKLNKRRPVVVDVRERYEYEAGHLKGVRNVPLKELNQLSLANGTPVYVLCQSGKRSKQAYKILEKKGMIVIDVEGGMNTYKGRVVK